MHTTADAATIDIIDRIHDAWTVDDAIFWREQFVRRLAHMIANVDIMHPGAGDEVALYQAAKGQSEQAIARLQMILDKGEVFVWPTVLDRETR